MTVWVSAEDVADALDVPVDAGIIRAAAAADAYARTRRPRLAASGAPPPPNVTEGALLYAVLLVQSRAQPDGFGEVDDVTLDGDYGKQLSQVHRLLGSNGPVVA